MIPVTKEENVYLADENCVSNLKSELASMIAQILIS